jgi:hypothetical protein
MKPIKSPGAVAALGASKSDPLGGKVFSDIKRPNRFSQAPLRAELTGSNRSTAEFGPLRVEYVVTVDDCDGTPVLPGFASDEIFWAAVATIPGGRTRWRRISLLRLPEAAP